MVLTLVPMIKVKSAKKSADYFKNHGFISYKKRQRNVKVNTYNLQYYILL